MLLISFLACQQGPSGPQPIDVANHPDLVTVSAPDRYHHFGEVLTSGSDLDHDGVLEWATVEVPWDSYSGEARDEPHLMVYEGTEVVRKWGPGPERWDWRAYGDHLATGDLDGDGFGDLALTAGPNDRKPRALVAYSTEREDAHIYVDADASVPGLAAGAGIARLDASTAELVVGLKVPQDILHISRFASEDVGRKRIRNSDPSVEAWLDAIDPEGPAPPRSGGGVLLVDADTDGFDDHVLFGVYGSELDDDDVWRRVGGALLCPLAQDPSDCQWLGGSASIENIGEQHAAADLDGDGATEIMSLSGPRSYDDPPGSVTVFTPDGRAKARIGGQGSRQFGSAVATVVDDEGSPWLLVASVDKVYGFPGHIVHGQLTARDAIRTWAIQWPEAIIGHRSAEDAPLQLLFGTGLAVHIIPFD